MLYRVTLDLAFPNEGPMLGILNHALGVFDQAITINPNELNEERVFIRTEKCYHDEDPLKPCEVIAIYPS